jgi:hypothetical protein
LHEIYQEFDRGTESVNHTPPRWLKMSANEVRLEPWTEITGKLIAVSSDDNFIYVKIGDKTLSIVRESGKSEIIQAKLTSMLGREIGILKTDFVDNPLRVRIIR